MGYTKAAKERELIQAIIEFQKSDKYQQDFITLFMALYQVTAWSNTDNLSWAEVQKALNTTGIPAMSTHNPKCGLGFPKKHKLTNKEITQLQEIIKKYQ